jgi:cyanate lyase
MVKIVIVLQVALILLSCKNISTEEYQSKEMDSLTEILTAQIDTTIMYNIEGVSLEGTEAKVSYADGQIRFAEVMVYGETGQAFIQYSFEEGIINVIEKTYRYKTDLTAVKSKDDIEFEAKTEYSIDYQGKFLKNPENDPLNIFSEFKESVPFELRN